MHKIIYIAWLFLLSPILTLPQKIILIITWMGKKCKFAGTNNRLLFPTKDDLFYLWLNRKLNNFPLWTKRSWSFIFYKVHPVATDNLTLNNQSKLLVQIQKISLVDKPWCDEFLISLPSWMKHIWLHVDIFRPDSAPLILLSGCFSCMSYSSK